MDPFTRELQQAVDFMLELPDDTLIDLLIEAGYARDEIQAVEELNNWN